MPSQALQSMNGSFNLLPSLSDPAYIRTGENLNSAPYWIPDIITEQTYPRQMASFEIFFAPMGPISASGTYMELVSVRSQGSNQETITVRFYDVLPGLGVRGVRVRMFNHFNFIVTVEAPFDWLTRLGEWHHLVFHTDWQGIPGYYLKIGRLGVDHIGLATIKDDSVANDYITATADDPFSNNGARFLGFRFDAGSEVNLSVGREQNGVDQTLSEHTQFNGYFCEMRCWRPGMTFDGPGSTFQNYRDKFVGLSLESPAVVVDPLLIHCARLNEDAGTAVSAFEDAGRIGVNNPFFWSGGGTHSVSGDIGAPSHPFTLPVTGQDRLFETTPGTTGSVSGATVTLNHDLSLVATADATSGASVDLNVSPGFAASAGSASGASASMGKIVSLEPWEAAGSESNFKSSLLLTPGEINNQSVTYYWELGEASGTVANDTSSGGTGDGTRTGGAFGAASVTAGTETSFSATSGGDRVSADLTTTWDSEATLPSPFNLDERAPWTVGAWFNINTLAVDHYIWSKIGWASCWVDANGSLHLLRSLAAGGSLESQTPNGTIVAGNDYFVVATWYWPSGQLQVYINGQRSIADGLGNPQNVNNLNNFTIGRQGPTVGANFDGRIQHVFLYQEDKLSAQEILNLYNAGQTGGGSRINPGSVSGATARIDTTAGFTADAGSTSGASAELDVDRGLIVTGDSASGATADLSLDLSLEATADATSGATADLQADTTVTFVVDAGSVSGATAALAGGIKDFTATADSTSAAADMTMNIDRGFEAVSGGVSIPTGWTSAIEIETDPTKVGGSGSHLDFPAYIDITDNALRTTGNGGDVTSASGFDIAFTANIDTGVLQPHELISYDGTTGRIRFFFKIPQLSTSGATTMYILIGNSSITTDQTDGDTFDAYKKGSFGAVYHLGDTPSSGGTVADSSGLSNDATGKVNFTAAQIRIIDENSTDPNSDPANSLAIPSLIDESYERLGISTGSANAVSADFTYAQTIAEGMTIQGWVRRKDWAVGAPTNYYPQNNIFNQSFFGFGNTFNGNSIYIRIDWDASVTGTAGNIFVHWVNGVGTGQDVDTGVNISSISADSDWHFMAVTWDDGGGGSGNATIKFHFDGVEQFSQSSTEFFSSATQLVNSVMGDRNGAMGSACHYDEMWFGVGNAHSEGFLNAIYNNQLDGTVSAGNFWASAATVQVGFAGSGASASLDRDSGFSASAGGGSGAAADADIDRNLIIVAGSVSGASAEQGVQISTTGGQIDTLDTLSGSLMTLEEYLSLLDIWNMAFTQLGVANIDDTAGPEPQTQIAIANWDLFKEQFLGDHTWNGAKKTAAFSRFTNSDTTDVTPPDRWSYAYEVPTDYVRALRINGKECRPQEKHWTGHGLWEEEVVENDISTKKRCIVTDETEANVEYIFLVSDVDITLLSGLTRAALALSFAAFLAGKFGKTPAEKQQLEQLAQEAQSRARRADSSIGTKLNPPNPNLIWTRF